uniref:SCP domain-containing protein n=1 Tax=Panagrolaimus sp. PS1159 TaxID=55785 RepID=A0AC35GS15_9BILA
MWKVIILSSVIIICATFAAICPTIGLSDSIRNSIVDSHNTLRSQLAQGQSIMKGGKKAASAKNMYKLKYDCSAEKTAQTWADKCVFQHSENSFRNAGENLFMMNVPNYNPQTSMTQAAQLWWKELADIGGISQTNTTLTMTVFNTGIGHWSQMAWAKSTMIGCGYKSCKKMTIVVCHYKTTGNYINQQIYEIGNPCKADKDCTTYANSKCDLTTKLCYN